MDTLDTEELGGPETLAQFSTQLEGAGLVEFLIVLFGGGALLGFLVYVLCNTEWKKMRRLWCKKDGV